MNNIHVLLADDDLIFCRLVKPILLKENYEVTVANSTNEAHKILTDTKIDVIMLDMCFPSLRDGFALLDKVHSEYPEIVILMISGSGHIPDAVLAIKNGASDFIEKPIEPDHMILRLKTLSERILAARSIHQLEKAAIGMVGVSAAMNHVFESIIKAARYDCPVLITGETGVGKELAAHAIHRLSEHGARSMVCINCASVPKELFEAELFGYEKGAFTGAEKAHRGYFEFAHNNSFFLDEISELPFVLQAKMLRVISAGEIQKVGGTVQQVKTRIISATNQDIEALVAANEFREDLFYRLNTLHIHIPPLRNRKEDIPALATVFVNDFCNRNNISPKMISPTALGWLIEQEWKGNSRELKNILERVVIFTTNDSLDVVNFTTPPDKTFMDNGCGESQSLRKAMLNFEKMYIEMYLKINDYNISKTAVAIKTDKSNLFKKIRALGILLPD
ncbi:MAG: sigma-54 dependent transcriptional regulator [Candidatus Cloacimonadaceae bacterium]|nr:sigma-54 dependent transcriptional regulator [Candidatus Cloacimonadaceae bacterium]